MLQDRLYVIERRLKQEGRPPMDAATRADVVAAQCRFNIVRNRMKLAMRQTWEVLMS
jgi:hypothetical protein